MVTVAEHQTSTDRPAGEDRWQVVLARDSRFDGAFVYGVRSTRIYCNPSCPSRRPRHNQVVFFPVPEMAEEAGFRPCRRCCPDLQPPRSPQLEMVRSVCQHIRDSWEGLPTLTQLAAKAGVSPYYLHRLFKRVTGITPRQYADTCRLGTLKMSLKNGRSITDALYQAGYGSSSRLYEQSSAQLGMTPAVYRRGGQGLQVYYVIVESPLGFLLVAATERGYAPLKLGMMRRLWRRPWVWNMGPPKFDRKTPG